MSAGTVERARRYKLRKAAGEIVVPIAISAESIESLIVTIPPAFIERLKRY